MMNSSYSEIFYEPLGLSATAESNENTPVVEQKQYFTGADEPSRTSVKETGRPQSLEICGGTLMMEDDGDMVSFVAEDLEAKIKLSSPVTMKDGPSLQRTVPPSPFPTLDPSVLLDLEKEARRIASGVDTIIENLSGTLHSVSSLTVDSIQAYKNSVGKTCDVLDGNIKCMYQLMAKCEELSRSVLRITQLHEQIKEVKRLLDLFEGLMS